MLHYFVNVTGRDWEVRTRFLTTDHARAAAVACILTTENARGVIRALDLTADQAVTCWYRMGIRHGGLTPPPRYRYAYELGRRIAKLKGEG